MAIFPPSEKIWWKEPIEKSEILWVLIALCWCIFMFFMMPYWHLTGKQNLSNEGYRVNPEKYAERVEADIAKYQIREEGDTGIPVVAPPVGGDIHMLARTFEWYPVLELKAGESYRLHLSSADVMHGFSLLPENINLQIHPEYEMVVTVTPTRAGEYGIVCNEFCGIGHHEMVGRIHVVD